MSEFTDEIGKIYVEPRVKEITPLQDRADPSTPLEIAEKLREILSKGAPGPYSVQLCDRLILALQAVGSNKEPI